MITGPWPMTADQTSYRVPLEPPYLTPMRQGERVALRVSKEDAGKWKPGSGDCGIITDLDTGKRYRLLGRSCELPSCYCDAEIILVTTTG